MNPILTDLEARIKALKDKHIDRWSFMSEIREAYEEALAIAEEAIALAEDNASKEVNN